MNKKIKNIGLIVNTSKPEVKNVATALCNWLNNRNVKSIMTDENAKYVGIQPMNYDNQRMIDEAEALIVLGGDGTILSTAHIPNITKLPMLGINLGSLGFLTEVTLDEIYPVITDILEGAYEIDERMMIKCQVMLNDEKVAEYIALNEVFLWRMTSMIQLDTYIDDKYFLTYKGDGVIIATPTGSTAYSLSAGGPIVEANMEAIILSPIASHALTVRPFIAHPESNININVCKDCRSNAALFVDGYKHLELTPEYTVKLFRAEEKIKLICSYKSSYYDILRNKFKWGERAD